MTQLTKQALALALKEAMTEKPFEQITVTEIVEHCNVNRKTFYYHFHDIYDLLGWIYQTEALDSIAIKQVYATWQTSLLSIFEYIKKNQAMCINTYRSLAKDHLEQFLNRALYTLIESVVDEFSKDHKLSIENKRFIIKFYANAFTGTILDWIANHMEPSETEIVQKLSILMDGHIHQAVERFLEKDYRNTNFLT